MSTIFEILVDNESTTAITGSRLFSSGSYFGGSHVHLAITGSFFDTLESQYASGSWNGVGVSFGISDQKHSGSRTEPIGWGISVSQGIVSDVVVLNHADDELISESVPSTLEGVNTVPWNIFPALPADPVGIRQQRDESRFKKVSSFTRAQPVRIRIFRQNVTVR